MTLCADFLVVLFQWLWLKATQFCTLSEFLQCAPSDDSTCLGLSWYSFIILTGFVSIDSEKKESLHFVCFLVLCLSYSRHVQVAQTEHIHIHQVVAEQVEEDLLERGPIERALFKDSTILMSDYEEDFTEVQNFSKTLSAESWVGAYRAESTDHEAASSGITVKIPPLFEGPTSWFKYEELIDDRLDLTQLEAGKRGPALKNRLAGDAEMYKGLLDRESLRATKLGPTRLPLKTPGDSGLLVCSAVQSPACSPAGSVGRARGSSSPRSEPTPRPAREAWGGEAPQPMLGTLHPWGRNERPLLLFSRQHVDRTVFLNDQHCYWQSTLFGRNCPSALLFRRENWFSKPLLVGVEFP